MLRLTPEALAVHQRHGYAERGADGQWRILRNGGAAGTVSEVVEVSREPGAFRPCRAVAVTCARCGARLSVLQDYTPRELPCAACGAPVACPLAEVV